MKTDPMMIPAQAQVIVRGIALRIDVSIAVINRRGVSLVALRTKLRRKVETIAAIATNMMLYPKTKTTIMRIKGKDR